MNQLRSGIIRTFNETMSVEILEDPLHIAASLLQSKGSEHLILILRPDVEFFDFLSMTNKMIIAKLINNTKRIVRLDRVNLLKVQIRMWIALFCTTDEAVEFPHNELPWVERSKILKIVDFIEEIKENITDGDYKRSLEYIGSFLNV